MHVFSKNELTKAGTALISPELPFTTLKGARSDEALHLLPVNLDTVDMKDVVKLLGFYTIPPDRVVLFDPWGECELEIPKELESAVIARSSYRTTEERNLRLVPLPALVDDLGACEENNFVNDVSFIVSLSHAADVSVFDSLRAATRPQKAPIVSSTSSREKAIIEGLTNTFTERGPDGIIRVKAFPGVSHQQVLEGVPSGEVLAAVDRPFLADVRAVNATSEPDQVEPYGAQWGSDAPPEARPEDAKARNLVRTIYGRKLILNTGAVPIRDLRVSLAASRAGVAVARLGSAPARLWEIASASRCAFLVGDVGKLPGEDVGANYDWIIARIGRDEASEIGTIAAQKLKAMTDDDVVRLGQKARETFDRFILPSSWMKWMPSAVEKLS